MAGRLEQMKDEIQKKDFEVKRLHSELNKTAASLMKAEMEVYKFHHCKLFRGTSRLYKYYPDNYYAFLMGVSPSPVLSE